MKLFYYPSLVRVSGISKIELLTQEAIDQLSEPERKHLQELDKEAIKLIGDRACYIVTKIEPLEERIQKTEKLRRLSEENLKRFRAHNSKFIL